MMRWIDEIANRKRIEELSFRKEIFLIRWSDHLIWLAEFYLTTSSFNSSCMNDSITNRICLFKTIRIVDSSSICWFRLESFYDHSIEDDLFKSKWFFSYLLIFENVERSMSTKMSMQFWWNQIEMTMKLKDSLIRRKNLVTIEDLDSQRNLDKSWDERSVNEIVEREFLYNELIFSSRLDRAAVSNSFFRQSIRFDSYELDKHLIFSLLRVFYWLIELFHLFASFYFLLFHQSSNQYDIENVSHHQFNNFEDELIFKKLDDWNEWIMIIKNDDETWWCRKIRESNQDRICRIYWAWSFYLFHDKIRCDQFNWAVDQRATWSRDFARRL
jgi:hypothetical protein